MGRFITRVKGIGNDPGEFSLPENAQPNTLERFSLFFIFIFLNLF